jgi:hypothetical protein
MKLTAKAILDLPAYLETHKGHPLTTICMGGGLWCSECQKQWTMESGNAQA